MVSSWISLKRDTPLRLICFRTSNITSDVRRNPGKQSMYLGAFSAKLLNKFSGPPFPLPYISRLSWNPHQRAAPDLESPQPTGVASPVMKVPIPGAAVGISICEFLGTHANGAPFIGSLSYFPKIYGFLGTHANTAPVFDTGNGIHIENNTLYSIIKTVPE